MSEARESLDEDNAAAADADAADMRAGEGSDADAGGAGAGALIGKAPARERKRERSCGDGDAGSASANADIDAGAAAADADGKVSAALGTGSDTEAETAADAWAESETDLPQRLPLRDAPWRLVEAGLGFSPQVRARASWCASAPVLTKHAPIPHAHPATAAGRAQRQRRGAPRVPAGERGLRGGGRLRRVRVGGLRRAAA